MIFDKKTNEIVLRTGTRLYCNNNIIGVDGEGRLWQGYDGDICFTDLTKDERVELSAEMIRRWAAWGDS